MPKKASKKTNAAKKGRKAAKPEKKRMPEVEISDADLRKLQRDIEESKNKSVVLEQDLRKLKSRLSGDLKGDESLSQSEILYRNFIFKCGKCVGEFKHTPRFQVIEHKVVCPRCREEHTLRMVPSKGRMTLSKKIKLVRQV